MKKLRKKFVIDQISVTFSFELVPSDMKWLAFILGELPNSAKYFLSFANVSNDDIAKVGCTYGGPSDDFQPWEYKNRVKIANAVAKFKNMLTQKQLAARTKVTEFIAEKKSRQEFEPILGPVIDKGFAEPLHLANNNWQFLFLELFEYVLHSKTAVPYSCKEISDLPVDCCLRKFLSCLKNEVKANRLHNAIFRWFREGRKGGASFTFRFTGEQTKRMCNGFCKLIKVVLEDMQANNPNNLKAYVLAFMAVNLRDAVSVFTRISDMNRELLSKLEIYCKNYFNAAALFVRVTVSVWTLGHVVPVHTRKLFDKYNTGLGLNTMQGREAKHQRLGAYCKNTTVKNRWHQVFRHEYMTLIWLREQNPFRDDYCKSRYKYMPVRCSEDNFCYCGLPKECLGEKCNICSSSIYKNVIKSVEKGKVIIL